MPRLGSGGSSKGPTLLLKRARTPLPSSSLAQALSFPALPSTRRPREVEPAGLAQAPALAVLCCPPVAAGSLTGY